MESKSEARWNCEVSTAVWFPSVRNLAIGLKKKVMNGKNVSIVYIYFCTGTVTTWRIKLKVKCLTLSFKEVDEKKKPWQWPSGDIPNISIRIYTYLASCIPRDTSAKSSSSTFVFCRKVKLRRQTSRDSSTWTWALGSQNGSLQQRFGECAFHSFFRKAWLESGKEQQVYRHWIE
jgi:hypothetical protein